MSTKKSNHPQFPLFIPSKGRADSRLTSLALDRMGVFHRLVIEEQEYRDYAAVVDKKKLLVLDKQYQEDYDTCDELGGSRSRGPGPARNFIWDYSINEGYEWHWVMDDNIKQFRRFNNNKRITCFDGHPFLAMETFCLRYENIAMAGPQYYMFIRDKWGQETPPFTVNTRIYSCNLIRNDVPFRWRGRYNEDTILSLDMLKAKYCTVQFNAFLQEKTTTQVIKGGNTAEFYAKEGTVAKSTMQKRVHPDVTKLVWKFGRHHHHVDYTRFKRENRLRLKEGIDIPDGSNDYGTVVRKVR